MRRLSWPSFIIHECLDRKVVRIDQIGRDEVGSDGCEPIQRLTDHPLAIRLKFLCEDRDRHGNVRCYVRMPGKPKVRIRALPGTPEFMEEYHAAVSAAAPDTVLQA